MQFHAILSNPDHPEYGVATIPFPLPKEEYDHSREVLSTLEIGGAVRQDCHVDEIIGGYGILRRLEGQTVNASELDYLAKRLDSFGESEVKQFQTMAQKLDLSNIRDFISLSFCCQQASVITDFSDLEQDNLGAFNELIKVISPLSQRDLTKLGAAVALAQPQSASHVRALAENLELFEFIPNIKNAEEYGKYMIQDSGHFEYDCNLEDFYDYEGYAWQKMSQEQGQFVENVYIFYEGFQSLDELMSEPQWQDYIGGMH